MTPARNNITLANTDNWDLPLGLCDPYLQDLLNQGNSSGDTFPLLMVKEICLHGISEGKRSREKSLLLFWDCNLGNKMIQRCLHFVERARLFAFF